MSHTQAKVPPTNVGNADLIHGLHEVSHAKAGGTLVSGVPGSARAGLCYKHLASVHPNRLRERTCRENPAAPVGWDAPTELPYVRADHPVRYHRRYGGGVGLVIGLPHGINTHREHPETPRIPERV